MANHNDNSRLLAENHLLALAALELVRRHDYVRINELNSYIHALTSELAIVRNERDQYRAEMVRLNLIAPNFGMTRYGRAHLHHPINSNRLKEAVVGAQQGEDFFPNDHGYNLGMENRFPAADIFALALDIQQSNTRMIELMSHINEVTSEFVNVSSQRDQFRAALESFNNNIIGWGRFRLH